MSADTDRRVRCFLRRGWCPVPWAHHPKPIRDALRAMGWRPKMKGCWQNAQRFACEAPRHGIEVEYREGYCQGIIPFDHGWLMYEGEVLDLTLTPADVREYTYLDSYAVSRAEVLLALHGHECWGPVYPERLAKLSPFAAAFEAVGKWVEEQVYEGR